MTHAALAAPSVASVTPCNERVRLPKRRLPAGHGALADNPGGDACHHAVVRDVTAHHRTAATTTFRPMLAPGKTIAPAPSHEPLPMLTGRFTGIWRPIGTSGSS